MRWFVVRQTARYFWRRIATKMNNNKKNTYDFLDMKMQIRICKPVFVLGGPHAACLGVEGILGGVSLPNGKNSTLAQGYERAKGLGQGFFGITSGPRRGPLFIVAHPGIDGCVRTSGLLPHRRRPLVRPLVSRRLEMVCTFRYQECVQRRRLGVEP